MSPNWKQAELSDIQQIKGTDGKTYQAREVNGLLEIMEVGEDGQPKPSAPPPPQSIMDKLMSEIDDMQEASKGESSDDDESEDSERPPKMSDNAFRARLRSVMTDNKYDRVLRGRTRGKLDMTRLHKIPAKSTSVFARKEARKNKSYNVIFLVDNSGSMGGDRARVAAESCIFLLNNFEGLNIRTEVLKFRNNGYVLKTFGQAYTKAVEDKVYNEIRYADMGNADYDAMAWAYSRFPKNDGQNLLVMLSDGEPTDASVDNEFEYFDIDGSKKMFKVPGDLSYEDRVGRDYTGDDNEWDKTHFYHLAERNRDVESIGVGIIRGGWQVPDHKVINNIDQLKGTMVEMLRKKVKRG